VEITKELDKVVKVFNVLKFDLLKRFNAYLAVDPENEVLAE
jgi:hypothetical protein